MAIKEEHFIVTDEKWGRGIGLDFYKDEVSIAVADKKEGGEIYLQWVHPQVYDNGERMASNKTIPLKITLGLKQQAIQRLEQFIYMLQGGGGKVAKPGIEHIDDGEDIPF